MKTGKASERAAVGPRPRALMGILLLAFGLRLATVLWLADTVPFSDYRYYQMAAEKISQDWGFFFDASQVEYYGRFGWWPPLYPFTLGALYSMFGVDHRLVVFVQVVLGTIVCGLVYRLGRRVGGERAGLIAALLVAINPTYVFATNLLASENLFVLWLVLGLLWATREPASRRTQIVAGVLLGLGALTRAIGLLVPFVVVAWMFQRRTARHEWARNATTLLVACFAIIAPWTLRNALVVGSPAIVCFGGGLNFYFGHNEVGIGYRDLADTPMAHLATQASIDRAGYDLGMRYIAAHPFALVTGAGRKTLALFASPAYATHSNSAILLPDGWRSDAAKRQIAETKRARQRQKNRLLDGLFTRLAEVHSYLLLAGALAAILLLRRQLTPAARLMAWLSVAWIAAHVLFWAQPRFRYPMEVLLMLLAGVAFASWRPRRAVVRALGRGVVAAAVLGCTAWGCAPAASKRTLPPIEPWGNLSQPYGDDLDAAAREALGPRDPRYSVRYHAIRLEDFWFQNPETRRLREAQAQTLRDRGRMLKRLSNIDSLDLYLEALHVAPIDVPSYEEAGRILVQRGASQRAHALIVQSIRLDPQNGVLWTLLGAAYVQIGNAGKARAAFEYALQQDDRQVRRTNVAEQLAALYIRAGEYARADSLVGAMATTVPSWLGSYSSAKEASSRGDVDAARAHFVEATRDPRAPSAVYVDLGDLERQRGDLGAAEAAYRKALQLEPHLQEARNGLGLVQWARGDLENASQRFARLVRSNTTNYVAQFNYAGVLLDSASESQDRRAADSLYALAAQHFGVCIQADYEAARARLGRSQAYLGRSDLDAAIADARQLASQPEYDVSARLLIARASLNAGNPSEAVQQLEPLYERGSLPPAGLATLGGAYLELQEPERAVAVLLRAVESGGPSLSVEMNYAVALSKSGRLEEAETVLRDLIDEHPNNANLLQNLAAVLQRQGRTVEADRLLIEVNRLEGR